MQNIVWYIATQEDIIKATTTSIPILAYDKFS